jgi:hypothetical protein
VAAFPDFRSDGRAVVSARFSGDHAAIESLLAEWFGADQERTSTMLNDIGHLPTVEMRSDDLVAIVMSPSLESWVWRGYLVYIVRHVVQSLGDQVLFLGFWDDLTDERSALG